MNQAAANEAAELLAAQIAALTRYRHVVEAQRAVLRMEDAGLLESFTAEAGGIVADISAREVQIMALRAAVQPDGALTSFHPGLPQLHAQVEHERVRAAAAANDLALQVSSEAGRLASEIKLASRQLDAVVRGYGPGGSPAMPALIDRRG